MCVLFPHTFPYSPKSLFLQHFFLCFLICLLFSPTVIPCPWQQKQMHLSSKIFNKFLWVTVSSLEVWIRWNKDRLFELVLQETTREVLRNNYILLPLVLRIYTENTSYWFLRLPPTWGAVNGDRLSYNDTKFPYCYSGFFFLSVCLVVINFWFFFQYYIKVHFDRFCQFIHCFAGEAGFLELPTPSCFSDVILILDY